MKKIKYVNDNLTIKDLGKNHWEGCQMCTLEFLARYPIGTEFENFEDDSSGSYKIYDNKFFRTTDDNWLYVNKKLFEIIEDKPQMKVSIEGNSWLPTNKIKKFQVKDNKIIGQWADGNDYLYTLSAPQTVLALKMLEIIDVLNELKNKENE